MGVRTWVRHAIEDGGTVRWALGLAVGLVLEVCLAAALAALVTVAVVGVAPPAVTRALFETSTVPTVWLSATVALFVGYTRGTFAATTTRPPG